MTDMLRTHILSNEHSEFTSDLQIPRVRIFNILCLYGSMKSSLGKLGVVSGVEVLTSVCGGDFLHDINWVCNVLCLCVFNEVAVLSCESCTKYNIIKYCNVAGQRR